MFLLLFYVVSSIAQDCNTEKIVAITPTERFTDHGDGTITDIKTGLMWKKCSEGQTGNDCAGGAIVRYVWKEALQRANGINLSGGFAGYKDWRLPNIKELFSIVSNQCNNPAINLSVFPNTPSKGYWSSSPHAYQSSKAWYVDFDYGESYENGKSNSGYIRLVRGGQ